MKIISIWIFLSSLTLGFCMLSCSKYFKYIEDDNGDVAYGRIRVNYPMDDTVMHLRVNLSLPAKLPNKYFGKIVLEKSTKESIDAIKKGLPIFYNVLFPLRNPIPCVNSIDFNNNRCEDRCRNYSEEETIITLDHFLYSPVSAQPELPQFPAFSPYNEEERIQIANGKISPGQWPWLAALFLRQSGHLQFFCAGTLITNQHIITSAKCVVSLENRIRTIVVGLGIYRLDDKRDIVYRLVDSIAVHPSFDPQSGSQADLAIIKLEEPVILGIGIQPLSVMTEIPSIEEDIGQTGFLVGWGKTELGIDYQAQARISKVSIMDQQRCSWINKVYGIQKSRMMICAGEEEGTGMCNNDHGSALVIYDSKTNKLFLRGVASLFLIKEDTGACAFPKYILYTDAAKHSDWIRATIF